MCIYFLVVIKSKYREVHNMIAKKMVKFVEGSSVTRAMFEEGKKMAVEFWRRERL